ncbi:MAG: phosphoribosylamine--glycine ligase [Bacteroidales bacterium]|nr:phosphoribosylamine--glycine ligase [Bacteroidales bacterium]
MNVLILGSGGREHAFAWKIAQSPQLENLFIAPGNAGTISHGLNVDLNPEDFDGIARFVSDNKIDMIVVGPEAPLVKGIRDFFDEKPQFAHLSVIGPSKAGAMLEGSKDFAKAFMKKHQIPTAAYQTFGAGETGKGHNFMETLRPPYVLKADGLAAGKGVIITGDLDFAKNTLTEMIDRAKFGEASSKVVIEEFLDGIEVSVFVLTDGKNYVMLPEAKDYKRIGEGDTGKNTGGMGSISPVAFADDVFMRKVEDQIIKPTIHGLQNENILYQGFIFFGLINVGGEPFVIEYNCRMGDPETEAVIPRIKSDFLELLKAVKQQDLNMQSIQFETNHAASVFLVSGGYPDDYEKGKVITGLENVSGSIVFHAGTKILDCNTVTSGGRVLAVTSLAPTMKLALEKSYENVQRINFDKKAFRRDLGNDLLKYTSSL